MTKKIIRLTESDIHRIVKESADDVIQRILKRREEEKKISKDRPGESAIDKYVRWMRFRFDNSGLKPILDVLHLKQGQYVIGGDSGYLALKLNNPRVEIREYDNGKIFVHFGYDNNAGAWGGFTRKYEVKDPNIFKNPRWYEIIKRGGMETSPDVIMMGAK